MLFIPIFIQIPKTNNFTLCVCDARAQVLLTGGCCKKFRPSCLYIFDCRTIGPRLSSSESEEVLMRAQFCSYLYLFGGSSSNGLDHSSSMYVLKK